MKLKAQVAKAILEHRYPEGGYDGIPPSVIQDIDALAEAVAGKLPQSAGIDFVRLMETWTEDQTNLTATLLDMAISVMLVKEWDKRALQDISFPAAGVSVTITSADLRTIAEQYHWERHEEPGSWTIRLQKISEMSSGTVDTQ